jgi:hypothetical protein
LEKPRVDGNICAAEDCDPNAGKEKAKFTLEQATKGQRESRVLALFSL